MILRAYQRELVDGSLAEWRAGRRRIAMVMATGGGKTPTAMTLAEMSVAAGLPVLWIAHRTELIDQAIDKAEQVAPHRRIGRLQGRLKQYRAEIVVGSNLTASTTSTLALLATRRWGLIVVDETHHVVADTYLRILRALRAYEPDGPLVLGVTATLDRSDGLALGQVFESVIEPRIGLVDLIRSTPPYLVPPRGIRVRIADLDLDRVRRTAGDLNSGQLGAAMSAAMAPQRIVEAWQEHAAGRPTLAFAPTVAFSIELTQAFNDAGIRAVHLDGKTPAGERDLALKQYRAGDITVVCNVGLFTEGTDLPTTSCVILKMTMSRTLYQQMVGRGLRLSPGKRDCIVLDPMGVTRRHKLATLVSLGGGDSPADIPDDLLMYEDDDAAAQEPETDRDDRDTPADTEPAEYVDGDLAHELVDLFGASHSTWFRSPGGAWFLPAGPYGFVFLAHRGDDRYDLRWVSVDQRDRRTASGTLREDMEIGYAMAAGDEYVAANPLWQAHRDAPWRHEPTPRRGGRGPSRGEVWDAQRGAVGCVLIDRMLGVDAPSR